MLETIKSLKAFIPDAFKWEQQWNSDLDPDFRERLKQTILTAKKNYENAKGSIAWQAEDRK